MRLNSGQDFSKALIKALIFMRNNLLARENFFENSYQNCYCSLGLTTVPYTATAVQNMVLYGYRPYCNQDVLTKSWLVTVTAINSCLTALYSSTDHIIYSRHCSQVNHLYDHVKIILDLYPHILDSSLSKMQMPFDYVTSGANGLGLEACML